MIAASIFDRQNAEAARLILANTDRYGGESAGLVMWARAVRSRLATSRGALRSLAVARAAGSGEGLGGLDLVGRATGQLQRQGVLFETSEVRSV